MQSQHIFNEYHRCFAKVDLDALDHNITQLQNCMAPGVKTCAVVKANAYGHGSVRVALHLEDRVDYFAAACIEEALELRQGGVKKPILVLTYTHPSRYGQLIENQITATVYNEDEAKVLSETALSLGKKAKLHVAVDTGMGRIGFVPSIDSADVIHRITRLPGLNVEGIFTHYACADCFDKTDKNVQTALFDSLLDMLTARGVEIPIKHACNSAGTMEPDKQYDMCRLGIAMYGLYPSEEVSREQVKLEPVMEVVSHVVHVKTVPAGAQISYGHIYTAPAERRIATVSIGYADGYNRCLTGVGYVLIKGKKAPVVGKVCMDQIMVDVTDIDAVDVGDCAVILGKSEGAEITAEALGEMSHSFNYEVVCNFMPRVKRVYYQNGKIL
ncbi:MAG: alanine racemase [Oscillospiraceae bacterium]|nr:alanine racemase [Oscillospiraceae bacterium]